MEYVERFAFVTKDNSVKRYAGTKLQLEVPRIKSGANV